MSPESLCFIERILVLCLNELNFEASSTNHFVVEIPLVFKFLIHSLLSSRWIVPLMIRCFVSFLAYWRCSDPQCLLPGHQPSNPRPQLQPHDRRLRSGQPRQRARKFTVPAVNDVTGNRAADHDWGTEGGRTETETETTFVDFRLRLFRTTYLLIVRSVANNLMKNVNCIPSLGRR